ncbi:Respiratory supercomplex factor 1, mitochondrial [Kickxella alabastrina]|uniref:Respiratory supercomplex factor 1, mitochondrial n=1 Tax=Kickxella alabastrina TaxID=61397 RepID=A0ACC1IR12_9FUNG|nr:Respiratory supercomplex factor 1, mitochondrial [Kickxella alabastrina]
MSSGSNTIIGRLKEEPLVPLGFVATVGAFLYAARGMHRGNVGQTQWGMRARVVMQGLTVAALLGYGVFQTTKDSKRPRMMDDVRQIDWEKLERDALAAENGEKQADAPMSPLDKLVAKAHARRANGNVFASESSDKKE